MSAIGEDSPRRCNAEDGMIAFSCAACGMKFSVKDEFAGRQTTCPTCRRPLVVPQSDSTVAFVAPQRIDGQLSSLARAGIDPGVTLGAGGPNSRSARGRPAVGAATAGRRRTKRRTLRARRRNRPRRHGRRSPRRRWRHPPRSGRQVSARSDRSGQEERASSRKRRSPDSSSIPTSCPSTNWASMPRTACSSR